MNAADPVQLFERVRALELLGRKHVAGRLAGDWITAIKGSGLLFEEPRRYVPGDPVRLIDWNITARVMEPHVRVHVEERQREVMVVLDVSPSMHVGFQDRTKLEVAVELAATLAVSAEKSGDAVGLTTFADRPIAQLRPRAGRSHLWKFLRELLLATRPWQREVSTSDPREAIHAIEQSSRTPQLIFLISDFLDHDVPQDLKYLRPRHEVSLLAVVDPLEARTPAHLRVPTIDPENRSGRARYAATDSGGHEEGLSVLRREAQKLGMGFASVRTDRPVTVALHDLLARRVGQ